MEAILVYVDNWISSRHIRRMDADEERGLLRLILHAAKEPDGGLPSDRIELADIALLYEQWDQQTIKQRKRFRGQTSGEKLLATLFELKDGVPVNALTGEEEVINTPTDHKRNREINISLLSPGRLYNARCVREFQCQARKSAGKVVAGVMSGKARQELRKDQLTQPSSTPEGAADAVRAAPTIENFAKSWATIQHYFQVDSGILPRIVFAARTKVPDITDIELARVLAESRKLCPNQASAGLWVSTVPQYAPGMVASLRAKARHGAPEYRCKLCLDQGQIADPSIRPGEPGWEERMEKLGSDELFQPCPECQPKQEKSESTPPRKGMKRVA